MSYSYIHVKSMLQLRQFIKLKGQIWDESGYKMEYPSPEAKMIIFIEHSMDEEKVLGTLELIPFNHVDKLKKMLFLSYPELNQRTTIFVDGFGVLASHRGKLETYMISYIINYAEKFGLTHAATLATEQMLSCISKRYRIPFKQVAAPLEMNGRQLFPVLLNLEFAYLNKHHSRFNWLNE